MLPLGSRTAAAPHCGWFPAVGAVVGGCGAAAGAAAAGLWGSGLTELGVVLAWAAVSGGLHLDGLADSCDALFSWQSRERKLEILRDSRIGAMGALGLLGVLAVQLAALRGLGRAWWVGALLAPLWGRWAAAYGIARFPAARSDGMGAPVRAATRPAHALAATLAAVALGAAVSFPWGALALLAVLPLTHVAARGITRSLGGLTGDAYGALVELGQCAALLWLAALVHRGVPLTFW